MSLASFRLKATGAGRFEVLEVNGQDVRGAVKAVRFDGASNDVGRLIVEFVTDDVEIEGDGVVYIHRGQDATQFLESIDTQVLEEAVLSASDWGTTPIATALDILKRWASGDTT